ncbi:hypothetical protein KI387_025853, partial [Taxus chinensis]
KPVWLWIKKLDAVAEVWQMQKQKVAQPAGSCIVSDLQWKLVWLWIKKLEVAAEVWEMQKQKVAQPARNGREGHPLKPMLGYDEDTIS